MTTALAVCLKATWRTDVALRLSESDASVLPDGNEPGLSSAEAGVLGCAIALKSALRAAGDPARLLAVTVGPPASDAVLRDALAAGADEVLRIWPAPWPGDAVAGLDGSAVVTRTKALWVADALRPMLESGPLLVVAGEASSDENHAAFGAFLAQALGLDFAHRVSSIAATASGWSARVKLERGYSQEMNIGPAAVMTWALSTQRADEAAWPAWLASRTAEIPLSGKERLDARAPRQPPVPATHLRPPLPRVKRFRVPDPGLSAEARIRVLLGSTPQSEGTVLPASAGPVRQVDTLVALLKARGYLADAP